MIFLDLGCGVRKKEGYIGIDVARVSGVDITCDIEKGLCIKDDCVDKIYSSFFFEHVRDPIRLFREICRICKNEAIVEIIVPYYASINAFQDPTHHSFFCEDTFRYFNSERYLSSGAGVKAGLEIVSIKYYYSNLVRKFYPEFLKRFLRMHFINMVGNFKVILKVKKNAIYKSLSR